MGPLDGLQVVELSHEHVAWAGKLLADLGARVVVVEPPGGSAQRQRGPYLEDQAGAERSLWWWHYNTGKRSVIADLDVEADRARVAELVAGSDVFLEGEVPARLAGLGLDWAAVAARTPGLIMVSVTPFGQASPRSADPITELTLMAEGGPVWSCGYDDHTLPPVRGGGQQGYQVPDNWAVISLLVALLYRERSGTGQHIDVSMSAANNVTTEMATYGWLAAEDEAQRQTGRHAAAVVTKPTQIRCRDGRYVNSGVPPREPEVFARVVDLLDRRGLRDEFSMTFLLEMAANWEGRLSFADIDRDPMVAEIFVAARDVVGFLADHLDAYDFFVETQRMGVATGAIYTPGEAMRDPNVVDRGFPTEVEHPELGRSFTYPGPPYRFGATPWATGRAPLLGEHQDLL